MLSTPLNMAGNTSTQNLSRVGGAGVVEVVADHRGDTFHAVYTVRFADAVYVLHAFQKKSKTGRETPKAEMELIERRLREAERLSKEKDIAQNH